MLQLLALLQLLKRFLQREHANIQTPKKIQQALYSTLYDILASRSVAIRPLGSQIDLKILILASEKSKGGTHAKKFFVSKFDENQNLKSLWHNQRVKRFSQKVWGIKNETHSKIGP